MDIYNDAPPEIGPDAPRSATGNVCSSRGRPKICVVHFIGRLIPGGVERRTLELIQAGSSGQFKHVICVTSGRRGSLDDDYCASGAQVEYLRIKSLLFPFRLILLMRRLRADVAHSNLANMSGYLMFLAFAAGVPNRITNFISDSDLRRAGRLSDVQHRIMRFLIDLFSTQIVGLTPSSLEKVWSPRWAEDPRCKAAPTGVPILETVPSIPGDLEKFLNDTILIHVGRADLPTKNREKAISVFAAYLKINPDARLVFVGRDGKDAYQERQNREAWDVLARDLGVSDRIHRLGEKDSVGEYLGFADGFLFTSTLEGLPGIVLEALAAGLPVIASKLPGTEFISEHYADITLLEPSDTDTEWAFALRAAVPRKMDHASRQASIAKFEESGFTLSAAVERYASLWKNHLEK